MGGHCGNTAAGPPARSCRRCTRRARSSPAQTRRDRAEGVRTVDGRRFRQQPCLVLRHNRPPEPRGEQPTLVRSTQ